MEEDQSTHQFATWLFSQPCEFVAGAMRVDDLPLSSLQEIAFAGRSNVGKSSLINKLTRRKSLARTSHTPGRTQQINFFKLSHYLMLVDLPGYGFAQASKKAINDWNHLIRLYLKGRAELRRVFILIDSRRGVMPADRETMKLLDDMAVSYQIILTKRDKIKEEESERVKLQIEQELKQHPAAHPEIISTSSLSGQGIEELQAALAQLARENLEAPHKQEGLQTDRQ